MTTFDLETQEHDIREAEARLRGGDTIENVAQLIYYRADVRTTGKEQPGFPSIYTGQVIEAAFKNLGDRPELQDRFDPNQVGSAISGHIPRPMWDEDTRNRLWVLEELHDEVTQFQKAPEKASSLRSFLDQIDPYISNQPDLNFLTDSANVNYVLVNYAHAAQRALEANEPAVSKNILAHFTSGPFSVDKALEHTDSVVYLRDWTAADLGIHHILNKPSLAPKSTADERERSQYYGGANTDHPLLKDLIASREPDFVSMREEISLAVNCLERGYEPKEVEEVLLLQRYPSGLVDTAGKNPFAKLFGGISNALLKAQLNDKSENPQLGTHQQDVVSIAQDVHAAFHRGLQLERQRDYIPGEHSPDYPGLQTDDPLLRELIMAQAPDDPAMQRSLSLAVNGVQHNHSDQRIFRDLDKHKKSQANPSTQSTPTTNAQPLATPQGVLTPRPVPESAQRTVAASRGNQATPAAAVIPTPKISEHRPAPAPPPPHETTLSEPPPSQPQSTQLLRPVPAPVVPILTPSPSTSRNGQQPIISVHGPGVQQPRIGQPQAVFEKAGPPRLVEMPTAIKPIADNKQVLNLAKEIHAKYQQQIRLREILATPVPNIAHTIPDTKAAHVQSNAQQHEPTIERQQTQTNDDKLPIRQRERYRGHRGR